MTGLPKAMTDALGGHSSFQRSYSHSAHEEADAELNPPCQDSNPPCLAPSVSPLPAEVPQAAVGRTGGEVEAVAICSIIHSKPQEGEKWVPQAFMRSGPRRSSREPFLPREPLNLLTEEGSGRAATAQPCPGDILANAARFEAQSTLLSQVGHH